MAAAAAAAVGPPPLTLYYGQGNVNSYSLRIAIAEKRLKCVENMAPYNLSKFNHDAPPSFTHHDPRRPGQFLGMSHIHPVLKANSMTINNTQAAMLYLEEAFPDPALLPREQPRRLRCMEALFDVPDLDADLKSLVMSSGSSLDPAVETFKKEQLSSWERAVALGHLGPDSGLFSLADAALLPRLLLLMHLGAGFEAFPRLLGYVVAMRTRESVARAYPEHWVDATRSMLKGKL